jgi:NADH:ubiquinone oxidoreductase subunit E
MFSTVPRGRILIEVCQIAPCLFSGGDLRLSWLSGILGVEPGGTTEDGLFTLETSVCCGRCAGAPTVRVGGEAFRPESREDALRLLSSYRDFGEDEAMGKAAREGMLCRD